MKNDGLSIARPRSNRPRGYGPVEKRTPELTIQTRDGFCIAKVEVFRYFEHKEDGYQCAQAFPMRITLAHDCNQLGPYPDSFDAGEIVFYVVGSIETGDLVRLFRAAITAVEATGIRQRPDEDQPV